MEIDDENDEDPEKFYSVNDANLGTFTFSKDDLNSKTDDLNTKNMRFDKEKSKTFFDFKNSSKKPKILNLSPLKENNIASKEKNDNLSDSDTEKKLFLQAISENDCTSKLNLGLINEDASNMRKTSILHIQKNSDKGSKRSISEFEFKSACGSPKSYKNEGFKLMTNEKIRKNCNFIAPSMNSKVIYGNFLIDKNKNKSENIIKELQIVNDGFYDLMFERMKIYKFYFPQNNANLVINAIYQKTLNINKNNNGRRASIKKKIHCRKILMNKKIK